jgi:hypothetical protein
MVQRRKPRHKGGSISNKLGIPVNGIDTFFPDIIPDLVLWIKADPKFIVNSTVGAYAKTQLHPEEILKSYAGSPSHSVITEIRSDTAEPNSLIRLESQQSPSTSFPEYNSDDSPTIDMSNLYDPVLKTKKLCKLVTKSPLNIKSGAEFSNYSISEGIKLYYLGNTTGQLLIESDYVANPELTTVDPHMNGVPPAQTVKPTAEFAEILVYSRQLTEEEDDKIQGYLAYKKNEQYKLPVTSPYLPEYAPVPEMLELINKMQLLKVAIQSDLQRIGNTSPALYDKGATAIHSLDTLRKVLSKAALIAKHEGDESFLKIESILQRDGWFNATLPHKDVVKTIQDAADADTELKAQVYSLASAKPLSPPIQAGGATEQELKEESYKNSGLTEEAAKTFYKDLRETSKRMGVAGQTEMSKQYGRLAADFQTLLEVFKHKYSSVTGKNTQLKALFKSVDDLIAGDKWLEVLKFMDAAKLDDGTYRDNSLKRLYSYYTYSKNQMEQGEYKYLLKNIDRRNDFFEHFRQLIEKRRILPVLKPFYMAYFKQEMRRLEEDILKYDTLEKELTGYLNDFMEFQTVAKQTGQPAVQDSETLEFVFLEKVSEFYIRRLNSFDQMFLGIEYIQTDSQGNHLETDGLKKEVYPFIHALYTAHSDHFKFDYGFKDAAETYKILEPFPDTFSILKYIPESDRPAYSLHQLESQIELSRLETNAIHFLETEHVTEGVLLPQNGLDSGAYYVLYNSGKREIPIQIPSREGYMTECLGPKDCILYSFLGGASLDEIGSYYGRFPVTPNYLPFDTSAGTPRTSLSVIIKDLNVAVYVREVEKGVYEAVSDTDGYLCQVNMSTDGNVYDIDDVYKTRPLLVTSLGGKTIAELRFPEGAKKEIAPVKPLYVGKDPESGLAILCRDDGVPCFNTFGYMKVGQTPVLQVRDDVKIRGATSDIKLVTSAKPISANPYSVEPYLEFKKLFRSDYVVPHESKYIFVTNNLIPILTPEAKFVEVDGITREEGNTIYYKDVLDASENHVFKMKAQTFSLTTSVEPYPTLDIQELAREKGILATFTRVQTKYKALIEYCNKYKEYLASTLKSLESLGEDTTKNIRETMKEVTETIDKKEADATAYNDTILAKLKNVARPYANEFKITVEIVESKMKTTADDIYETVSSTHETVKLYLEAIQHKEEVEKSLELLKHETSDTVSRNIDTIQETGTKEVHERGTTSAPDIEELLKKALEQKDEYTATLKKLEELVEQRPKLITEMLDWYKQCKTQIDSAQHTVDEIGVLKTFDMPHLINKTKKQLVKSGIKALEAKSKEMGKLMELVKAVAHWIGGIVDDAEYKGAAAVPIGDPSEIKEGLGIKMPPFEIYKNPQVERDWHTAPPDITANFEAEVKQPLEGVKPIIKGILENPSYQNYEIPMPTLTVMDYLAVNAKVDAMDGLLTTLKDTIKSYEILLEPIFKEWVNLTHILKEFEKTSTDAEIQATRVKWKELVSLSLASETKLEAMRPHIDAAKYEDIKNQFDSNDVVLNGEIIGKIDGLPAKGDIATVNLDIDSNRKKLEGIIAQLGPLEMRLTNDI